MSEQSKQTNPFEAFTAFSGMRDAYLDAWSKVMSDMVNSEEYAEANAKMLDNYLTLSAPLREALERTMTKTLTHLNMPTRSDITGLAERLTAIEMKLDDLDAKLDGLARVQAGATATEAKRRKT
jgi:polyhydroxyalkanoate synthesis regulator phasin